MTSAATTKELVEHPALSQVDASSIAEGIVSGDVTRLTAAVAYPSDVAANPSVATEMMALAPVLIESESFVQISDEEAYVYATVGADQQPWTFYLLWQDTRWMITETYEGHR